MSVSLKGQVALVVGASSGIGRETAVLFAREGARVVASARRGDRLRGLQDELAKEGHSIEISPADASNARKWSNSRSELARISEVSTSWFTLRERTRLIVR